jgi:hypothetical protein
LNPTDSPESFLADALLPLKQARQRRKQHYFELRKDDAAASYWAAPATRTGGIERRTLADSDGPALLTALAEHWLAQGDDELASLLADLLALQRNLKEAAPAAADCPASPSYSAYPLF